MGAGGIPTPSGAAAVTARFWLARARAEGADHTPQAGAFEQDGGSAKTRRGVDRRTVGMSERRRVRIVGQDEHAPAGVDVRTGMSVETLTWMLEATARARPTHVTEDYFFWLNGMAALASAFLRAGGAREALARFETDGLTFSSPNEAL